MEARRLSWTLLTDRGEMMAEIWLEFLFLLEDLPWLMTDWCLCLECGGDTRAAREMLV